MMMMLSKKASLVDKMNRRREIDMGGDGEGGVMMMRRFLCYP
jgi:hypothetical protein